MKTISERIYFCCGRRKCPSLQIVVDEDSDELWVDVFDDFKGKVRLKASDALQLSDALEKKLTETSEKVK